MCLLLLPLQLLDFAVYFLCITIIIPLKLWVNFQVTAGNYLLFFIVYSFSVFVEGGATLQNQNDKGKNLL